MHYSQTAFFNQDNFWLDPTLKGCTVCTPSLTTNARPQYSFIPMISQDCKLGQNLVQALLHHYFFVQYIWWITLNFITTWSILVVHNYRPINFEWFQSYCTIYIHKREKKTTVHLTFIWISLYCGQQRSLQVIQNYLI